MLAPLLCAQLGGRAVRSWQFGLRRPRRRLAAGGGADRCCCCVAFLRAQRDLVGGSSTPARRSCSNSSGPTKAPLLLVLSAALTCVVAPICEEFLFRGYIFTALRNWRGTWPAAIDHGLLFGGVHAGSAPALDLRAARRRSASGCACSTATAARCTRASPRTRSTTRSPSRSLEDWSWLAGSLLIAALARWRSRP